MSWEAFLYIYQEVAPFVYKSKAILWNTVPAELGVAVTLYLSSGYTDYYAIANLFNIGKSAVCVIVCSTCKVIVEKLITRFIYLFIYLPCSDEVPNIMPHLSSFPLVILPLMGFTLE